MLRILILVLLGLLASPAWAITPKLPKGGKRVPKITMPKTAGAAPKAALSATHQQALRHAAALRATTNPLLTPFLRTAQQPVPPPVSVPKDPQQLPQPQQPQPQQPTEQQQQPQSQQQEAQLQEAWAQWPSQQQALQQRLTNLERRIATQQLEASNQPREPLWLKNLATMPERKTPRMWLKLLQDYILEYRQFPINAGESEHLYAAYHRVIHSASASPAVVMMMKRLRKQYPPQARRPSSPQKKLEELKAFEKRNHRFPSAVSQDPAERSLYIGIYNVYCRLGMNDPISQKMRKIQDKYPVVHKSPQEWADEFELFIQTNNRLPSKYSDQIAERALNAGIHRTLKNLDPQDPIVLRIRELWKPFEPVRVSPQEWADRLEAFTAQHHRLPRRHAGGPEETALYKGVYNAVKHINNPDDPTVVRIHSIQRLYSDETQKLLTRLERFVYENEHFPTPSIDGTEDKLYWDTKKMLDKLPVGDQAAIRIRELQLMYSRR